MGVLRVERARTGEWVTQQQGSGWPRFDIQLTFYGLALAIIGLLMAWSNSNGAPLVRVYGPTSSEGRGGAARVRGSYRRGHPSAR